MRISGALQKQVSRDVQRHWNVDATVNAYARLGDVPPDYWTIVIREDLKQYPDASGIHFTRDGQPMALVRAAAHIDQLSHTISHELIEMIVDPYGNKLVAGQSPVEDQGRVNFLVEVCDPSQSPDFGYRVNGIFVCDFFTPNYFDPVDSNSATYSFGGHIQHPRQVLPGGYLSWINPADNHLWQANYTNGRNIKLSDRGVFDPTVPIRFQTDRFLGMRDWPKGNDWEDDEFQLNYNSNCQKRAKKIESQIKREIRKAKKRQKNK